MTREKRLNIRVTEIEIEKLQAEAQRQKISVAEVIRGWINKLPEPSKK